MACSDKEHSEEGTVFVPRFDAAGLITAVVCEHGTGHPLMVAFMNQQAIDLTFSTGEAHFFSRSRQEIWHKGGTSGNVLTVHDMNVDCDQDVLWITATPQGNGAACHTGRKSCFYRKVNLEDGQPKLEITDDVRLFDPNKVYSK